MVIFEKIESSSDLQEIIKAAFDADFPIDGGWGYTKELATIIKESELPITQLEHTIASMRTHLEMNMTRQKKERYGSINLNETQRESYQNDSRLYHKVTYSITAMKEEQYNDFIEEYKEGYGKKEFDLSEYFERRKRATLSRTEAYWFEIEGENA